jgi:hypothetical protein
LRHYRLNRFSEGKGIEQMALSGKQEDLRNQSAMRTGDPLYQIAKVNHVRKLIDLAEKLQGQLWLPQPSDSGSWVPPQGYHYRLHTIHTGSNFVELGPHFLWELKDVDPGIIRLAVEEENLYFACLISS